MDIQFKKPELEDRDLINSYLAKRKTRSCEMTFANVYLWSGLYPTGYAIIDDMLVFANLDGDTSFTFPWGDKDPKPALDILLAYCEEKGVPFQLHNATKESFEMIDAIYPGRFKIEYERDFADYVYETEKLAKLSGKKYHGKKNHVNKFNKLYEDWAYEPITDANREECIAMVKLWRDENGCDDDIEKKTEICVALRMLNMMDILGLKGGLLRVNGEVVAVTLGEPVCDDTMVVHIEKALAKIEAAYTVINQQFALHEGEGYLYWNREDDVGAEGLRQAKLSYHPAFLVEKGLIRERK